MRAGRRLVPAKLRTCVRRACGAYREPVVIIKGSDKPPELVGSRWCYTTKTGKPIQYPSAYAKVGWSTLTYHPSDLRVEVGEAWPIPDTNYTAGDIEVLEVLLLKD